ncbi:YeeE/YedE family protein [Candidatus Woesearchaeota archaeon]|nr:YeeE/YedE family protein [Candidatus Woesearchaeota archaeon]
MTLFPIGIFQYALGGALIGIAISLMYAFGGQLVGQSTFFSSSLSYVSRAKYFQQEKWKLQRNWRFLIGIGTILGAVIFVMTMGEWFTTRVQWWRLFLGGLFVGFGARFSRGCTSGHGICGLSSFSLPSLIAVAVFMSVAIIVALSMKSLGVSP